MLLDRGAGFRCVLTVTGLVAAAAALGLGSDRSVWAMPDNARGCPPRWHEMPTEQLTDEQIADLVPIADFADAPDVQTFVWSNILKTDGFAAYMALLDNNGDGTLCVKWVWGDRLSERSSVRRDNPDFDPLYFFTFSDNTSAAP